MISPPSPPTTHSVVIPRSASHVQVPPLTSDQFVAAGGDFGAAPSQYARKPTIAKARIVNMIAPTGDVPRRTGCLPWRPGFGTFAVSPHLSHATLWPITS